MSESASISSGIAGRYAAAVFEIARDENALDRLSTDIDALAEAIRDSADLRALLTSPIYSRREQGAAISAVAERMDLMPAMRNVLGLMASKRRLFVVPQMIARLREMIAEARGEVTAEVTSASPLSEEQAARLAQTLRDKAGREVRINATVDESLIGGLVVKLGSKMIDTSIRSKLASLQNVMKEVG